MMALFADGATHTNEAGDLPSTGPAIVADVYQPFRESSGWRQQIVSLACEGEFMTSLFRNHFADGTSALGCGIARIDEDGKILSILSYTELSAQTKQRSQPR